VEPVELATPARLAPQYARALVTGPLRRGSALPDTVLRLRPQPIERDRLTAYQQVCGYRVGDVLPPTYPHVLAFPAAVALMTGPNFPFPLVGLVHLGNAIKVARPVRAAEQVGMNVRLADLRAHPAGRAFDVLVEATVGREPVWTSRSTYLRRRPRARPPQPRPDAASGGAPATALLRIPGDTGRRYATVSGDRNPIHLCGPAARAFGFRAAIAHGMWLKARVLATVANRLPDSYEVDVRFKAPVLLPATVAVGSRRGADGWRLDVRDLDTGKPHLTGTITG
jgi:acyl dehydratase